MLKIILKTNTQIQENILLMFNRVGGGKILFT